MSKGFNQIIYFLLTVYNFSNFFSRSIINQITNSQHRLSFMTNVRNIKSMREKVTFKYQFMMQIV